MESILLALETSTSSRSVAILQSIPTKKQPIIIEKETLKKDVGHLLDMISNILNQIGLKKKSLQAIAFGQGPGSFTGTRIACSLAQSIGFIQKIRIIPIVSHKAIAEQSKPMVGQTVIIASDARLDEVYLSVYRYEPSDYQYSWITLQEPILIPYRELIPTINFKIDSWLLSSIQKDPTDPSILLAGNAWYSGEIDLSSQLDQHYLYKKVQVSIPRASSIALLANEILEQKGIEKDERKNHLILPLYVRDKVAFTLKEQKLGNLGNPKSDARSFRMNLQPTIMTVKDLNEVVTLEEKVQIFPWTRKKFSDAMDSRYSSWVLRNENGILLGFIIVMIVLDLANLLTIAVEPSYQRKKIGSTLLSWCEKQSKTENQSSGLFLEVRQSNETAISFYMKHGYSCVGVRKNYYQCLNNSREDALIMKKKFT